MKTTEIFQEVYQLLKKGWTQGFYALDKNDCPVAWHSEAACCFCIVGAIYRTTAKHGIEIEQRVRMYDLIESQLPEPEIDTAVTFNDDPATTKEMVLAFVKKCEIAAIQLQH